MFTTVNQELTGGRSGMLFALLAGLLLAGCSGQSAEQASVSPTPATLVPGWRAGDHHVHSRFSVGWDTEKEPPAPILAGDAIYPIPMNALMARHYGLSWMVTTDHGGPGHSKVTRDWAYPALLRSRTVLPGLLQYHGLELNPPGGDHATLIVPRTDAEAEQLFHYESTYDRNEPWPRDEARDNPALMLTALQDMGSAESPPVVIANHPSRSGSPESRYGRYEPAELRNWNDAAPNVAVGFAGAPGHQAITLAPDGSLLADRPRGAFAGQRTMGGFDPMTARLGGLWDTLLGEGRRWWITANSDSHRHYTEQGVDFWPGEYSKTWVYAPQHYHDVLEAIRGGRMFVATGDLISGLSMTLSTNEISHEVWPGDTLRLPRGVEVTLTVTLTDPSAPNSAGREPALARLDVITGETGRPAADLEADSNPSTRVAARYTRDQMQAGGELLTTSWTTTVTGNMYIRLRGTNTAELEPESDPNGENPWDDLWFYSNPVFIETK